LLQDDGTAQSLRTFDDGFVGPSGWGWAQGAGVSQYWGYNDASQYDAGTDTLSFQSTLSATETAKRTRTRVTPGAAGWSGSEQVDGAGLLAKFGYFLKSNATWSVGVQMAAGWLNGINSSFNGKTAYSEQIEDFRWRTVLNQQEVVQYKYDTLGNPAFPAAPYSMSDPSGVGPMMADRPSSITRLSQSQSVSEGLIGHATETATSLVDVDVEASALSMQLGPRLQWKAARKLNLTLQPAVTLNLLDSEIHRQETFQHQNGAVIQTWNDSSNEQNWLVGAGVQADVQWDIVGGLYLVAGGGYDWVESCDVGVGPDQISIDLSGYNLNAAVGYRF
jgi:hypothetical protein